MVDDITAMIMAFTSADDVLCGDRIHAKITNLMQKSGTVVHGDVHGTVIC